MRLPKFRHTILAASVLGIVLPLAIMAGFQFGLFSTPPGDRLLYVWPSSIMLMATDTLGHSLQAFAILAWSISWNVFLYFLLFTFIWCVSWCCVLGAHRCEMEQRSNQSLEPTAGRCEVHI